MKNHICDLESKENSQYLRSSTVQKNKCYLCCCTQPQIQCVNCPKLFHVSCVRKNFGRQPTLSDWFCNFCQLRRLNICQICNSQIKQHLQPREKPQKQQTISNYLDGNIQNYSTVLASGIVQDYRICTYCCCKYHQKCTQVPKKLTKPINFSYIKNQNTLLCQMCLKNNGFANLVWTQIVTDQHDQNQQTLYFYVKLCNMSPIHFGWFPQMLIKSSTSNKNKIAAKVEQLSQPIIQKIVRIKIPKKYQGLQRSEIFNILYERLKLKSSKYGDIDNFKFLVKWKQFSFGQCTWEDQCFVMSQPSTLFKFVNILAYYQQKTATIQDITTTKIGMYQKQKWAEEILSQNKAFKSNQNSSDNHSQLMMKRYINNFYFKKQMPAIILKLESIKIISLFITKQIYAFLEMQKQKMKSSITLNIFVFVCEQQLIQLWHQMLSKYFPSKQVLVINGPEVFMQPQIADSVLGFDGNSPKFQFLIVKNKFYSRIIDKLFSRKNQSQKYEPKFKIGGIFYKDLQFLESGCLVKDAFHTIIHQKKSKLENQQLVKKILLYFNCSAILQYRVGFSLNHNLIQQPKILPNTVIKLSQKYVNIPIGAIHQKILNLYLIRFGVFKLVDQKSIINELYKFLPKFSLLIQFYSPQKYWQYFKLYLYTLNNIQANNQQLSQICMKIFGNLNPIKLYKHICNIQRLNIKFQQHKSNPNQFCADIAQSLNIPSYFLFMMAFMIIKHGFSNWAAILEDNEYIEIMQPFIEVGELDRKQPFLIFLSEKIEQIQNQANEVIRYIMKCYQMICQ